MNDHALVHEANLRHKEHHPTKYRDDTSRGYLDEIRTRYNEWHAADAALVGPRAALTPEDRAILAARVHLFEGYRDFIDQQHYAEQFDSRSNLHSTALEQFIYCLFRDLVGDFGPRALIGKSHTFKDMFFAPPSYSELLRRPYAQIEKKDHDFVIGATIEASFTASVPLEQEDDAELTATRIQVEKPSDHDVAVTDQAETHLFDIPAIAIECKTYLDKTMLEASSRAVEELKARFPDGLYIVVMEWIKSSSNVNLKKYKVDQIYVLRKQKNTDREFRYDPRYAKSPIDVDTVVHLYEMVRSHLVSSATTSLEARIRRGWLMDD